MKDFPSCFGENGIQVADSSSSAGLKAAQNLVTCVYESQSRGILRFITVTWTKNLMGRGASINFADSAHQCLGGYDIKSWLISKTKGFKSLEIDSHTIINIYWDLSSARFGSAPEPIGGFYLAVVCNQEIVLLLGDLHKEMWRKIDAELDHHQFECNNAVLIAKKENIFGKKQYRARAQLSRPESRVSDDNKNSKNHDIVIECDTSGRVDPCLVICVDGGPVLQVKNLRWKFRGNHAIWMDGLPVEVFWDVHDWLFGDGMGNAVFLFRNCHPSHKLCSDECVSRLTWSGPQRDNKQHQPKYLQGFSLLLYAWKNE